MCSLYDLVSQARGCMVQFDTSSLFSVSVYDGHCLLVCVCVCAALEDLNQDGEHKVWSSLEDSRYLLI